MSDGRRGLLFGIAAYAMWGLFPLYWPLVRPAGALEILAHRVVWSLVVVVVILVVQRDWAWIRESLRRPGRVALMSLGAILIAINWAVYIWGVNHDQVVETSLGYFVNPLVTVLLGVLVLSERLRPMQWAAIGLGVAVGAGARDRLWPAAVDRADARVLLRIVRADQEARRCARVTRLTVETATLLIPCLVYLGVLEADGRGTFGHGVGQALLLVGAGVVTAVPLLCFAGAARRLPLTTLGLLQYLTPVMQFALGVLVFHEAMPALRLMGFALVWVALIVLSADMIRHQRTVRSAGRVRSAQLASSTPGA